MELLEKHLYLSESILPGAGRGLFTRVFIPKGKRIAEYKGRICTWKEVKQMPDDCYGYTFFFNNNHVIDAWNSTEGVAQYVNDANGIVRVPGVKNNSEYETEEKRCFIKATCDIPAGSEILVGYGADYWRVIRHNISIDEKRNSKNGMSGKPVDLPHHLAARRNENPIPVAVAEMQFENRLS